MTRRIAAAVALAAGVTAPVCAVLLALGHIGALIVAVIVTSLAAALVWIAVTRGAIRIVAAVTAAAALIGVAVGFFVVLALEHALRDVGVIVALLALGALTARYALDDDAVRADRMPHVPTRFRGARNCQRPHP